MPAPFTTLPPIWEKGKNTWGIWYRMTAPVRKMTHTMIPVAMMTMNWTISKVVLQNKNLWICLGLCSVLECRLSSPDVRHQQLWRLVCFNKFAPFKKWRLSMFCDKISCKIHNKTFQRFKVGQLKGFVALDKGSVALTGTDHWYDRGRSWWNRPNCW